MGFRYEKVKIYNLLSSSVSRNVDATTSSFDKSRLGEAAASLSLHDDDNSFGVCK